MNKVIVIVMILFLTMVYAVYPAFPQNNLGPVNYDLSESFIKTKSYATFTLEKYRKMSSLKVKIVLNKKNKQKSFMPSHVEIYDLSKSKLIQKIKPQDKSGWEWDENSGYPWVGTDDINFDGYPDLRFLIYLGSMGNDSYATYIYNPKSHQFEFNKILSESSSVSIDPKTKQITAEYNGGACEYHWDSFKVVNGKVVRSKSKWTEMVRRRDEEGKDHSGCFIYTGIPRSKPIKLNPKKNHGNLYYRENMKIIKEEPE